MAKQGRLEGAPDWYGTPVDQLDFEWSEEEQLELEDYCHRIHMNLAESGDKMTPLERWEASLEGRDRTDCFLKLTPMATGGVPQTLDARWGARRASTPDRVTKTRKSCSGTFPAILTNLPYVEHYLQHLFNCVSREPTSSI